MTIDATLIGPVISVLGAGLLAAVGFIMRTLSGQNRAMASQTQALAVLVARIDPAIDNVGKTQALSVAVAALEARVTAVAADVAYLRGAAHTPQPVTVPANA